MIHIDCQDPLPLWIAEAVNGRCPFLKNKVGLRIPLHPAFLQKALTKHDGFPCWSLRPVDDTKSHFDLIFLE